MPWSSKLPELSDPLTATSRSSGPGALLKHTPSPADGLNGFDLISRFPPTPSPWANLLTLAVASRNALLFAGRGDVADRFVVGAVAEGLHRQEKILVLASTTAAADHLIHTLPDAPGPILRAIGPLETRVAGLTVHAAGEGRVDEALKPLAATLADKQAQLALWEEAQPEWDALAGAVTRLATLTEQDAATQTKLERAAETVRANLKAAEHESATSHAASVADVTTAIDTAIAKRTGLEQQRSAVQQNIAQISKLVAAKNEGKLLSLAFWQAMLMGDPGTKLHAMQQQLTQWEAEWTACDEDVKRLKKQKNAADKEWAKQWDLRVAAEVQTVETSLRHERERLAHERASVLADFQVRGERLRTMGLSPPAEPTHLAIEQAQNRLAAQRQDTDVSVKYVLAQVAELTANRAALVESYLGQRRVVVASRAALENRWLTDQRFDRVVIHGAEFLSRSEWDTVNTVSEQLVVVGNWPARPNSNSSGPSSWSSPVTDLWNEWHQTNWFREADRLVCRLTTVPGALTREELLDQPEVELRFGTTTEGEYVLAEVAFPTSHPVAAAKRSMVELGDLSVNPFGPVRWHDDKLMVCWPLLDGIVGEWVELEPGVREQIVAIEGVPTTAAVSFDSDAGWTRDRANEWLSAHQVASHGRTVVLQ